MAKFYISCVFFVFFIVSLCRSCDADNQERQVHIVYMGSLPEGEYSPSSHHFNILKEVVDSSFVGQSLIRSYKRSFNGFAAYLTDQERQKIASYEGVVSVFRSKTLQPQTTRSWDFMGLSKNVIRNPTTETNIIIGVLDTGIWPESDSFSDHNIGPIPKKWKGVCEAGNNFTCNNKIIGARYYNSLSPSDNSTRDSNGHGSHTASTAAGNHVKGASFYGLAQGTARGGVPSARIAAYKVCSPLGCNDTDILAAYDDAIADGVDLITVSLGSDFPFPVDQDSISIGAFHAMARGILTVNSAGNNGNALGTVTSVAPWLFTVAASTIDRRFVDKVVLGNGRTVIGNAVNSFNLKGTSFPLIYGQDGSTTCEGDFARLCFSGCLDSELVKGKIVLCQSFDGLNEAYTAGALGSIILGDEEQDYSVVAPYPTSILSNISLVEAYIDSTKIPKANILKSETVRDFEAPVAAYFSSRGPNSVIQDILKPDISAPGVNILAAFSPTGSPSDNPSDKRSVKYSILSGTSMSCPHVTGAAAYVKSLHPDWSPAAIKSALMTTAISDEFTTVAWRMNSSEAEFAYGAGHIDPVKAANPGLVYETSTADYVKMLCSIGIHNSRLKAIFGGNISCPAAGKKGKPKDLNYPSMAANVEPKKPFTVSFPRTVTNVGLAKSVYKATITKNSRLNITVSPSVLSFNSLKEKKSFAATVEGKGLENMTIESASLVWSDGTHSVRTPIVVYTITFIPA